jgi:Fic family protein
LEAVSKAASDSLETIHQLSALHDTSIEKLPKTTRSKDNLRAVFDYIEQYPIIDIKRTAKELDISYNTAATAVKKLVELGILKETTNVARNRVFAYEEYLGILRKDT